MSVTGEKGNMYLAVYEVSGLLWYGREGGGGRGKGMGVGLLLWEGRGGRDRGRACKLNCQRDVQRNFDATTQGFYIFLHSIGGSLAQQ